jgi:hypothetical protein
MIVFIEEALLLLSSGAMLNETEKKRSILVLQRRVATIQSNS